MFASAGVADDRFGLSLGLSGDGSQAWIGTSGASVDGIAEGGGVGLATRSGATWPASIDLFTSSETLGGDELGAIVAISSDGRRAVACAQKANTVGGDDAGMRGLRARALSASSRTASTRHVRTRVTMKHANIGLLVSLSPLPVTALLVCGCSQPVPPSDSGSDALSLDAAPTLTDAASELDAPAQADAASAPDAATPRCNDSMSWGPRTLVAGLMSPQPDSGAAYSENELIVVFASRRPPNAGFDDLFMATRTSRTAVFDEPIRLDALATSRFDTSPALSPDGRDLYFR
jgi:hypothetical protein